MGSNSASFSVVIRVPSVLPAANIRAPPWLYHMTILFILWLLGQSNEQELFELDALLPEELLQKEVLLELTEHPLDLNQATEEELLKIPFLNPVLVKRIIKYRQQTGFKEVSDLLKIPGFDPIFVLKLSRLVTVHLATQKQQPMGKKVEARLRISDRDFSFNDSFRNRSLYSRIDGTIGNYRLVVITEKDSGEASLADFWSTSIGYSDRTHRLVVGNYLVALSQGLVFAAPFGFISGPEFSMDIGKGDEIRPQTLSSENTGLFGLGYSQNLGSWVPIVVFSAHKLDAQINPDGSVDHISADGLHSDSASLKEKDQLGEFLFGSRLAWKHSSWAMGFTGYTNRYNREFRPEDSTDSFYGDHLTVLGADLAGNVGDYFTLGECGYSLGNGFAGIFGLAGEIDRLKLGLSLRGYERRFFSPHSRTGSLKDRRDRLEAYFNTRYQVKGFQFLFYGTIYQDFVTDSMPGRFQVEVTKTEKPFDFGLVLKQSFKEDSPRSQGGRFDIGYNPWKWLKLSLRLEDRYGLEKTVKRGFLVFGNCDVDIEKFNFSLRVYKFDISPSARIYAYEPGLAGLGGNHSFAGSGVRAFGLFSMRLGKRLNLAIKSGLTRTDSTTVDFASQVECSF